jgi:hypothetical protein
VVLEPSNIVVMKFDSIHHGFFSILLLKIGDLNLTSTPYQNFQSIVLGDFKGLP